MKVVAIIPARLKSTRLPNKPLADINGKPMIQHVYERVSKADLDDVIVACDDLEIFDFVRSFGGNVVMTSVNHINGSSRIAEVAGNIEADVILNVQGDEPLINKELINRVIEGVSDSNCVMATLKQKIIHMDEIKDPNCVKVITDCFHNAIYFSRFPVPYLRDNQVHEYYKHIGIYAYKKKFLLKYVNMKPSELELAESLEQLRVLENGYKIKVLETFTNLIGVDTQADLEKVREILRNETDKINSSRC